MRDRLLGAKRIGAADYLLVTVVAFALTVVATRWYLELAGYPKVGAGGLHVAHVLWGGLLLIVGALLPMLFVGRRVMQLSAITTGVGVGLFIDEVGKFITETNDYFFAPAAPLIYGGVLLLMLLWVTLRQRSGGTPHDAVQAAIQALSDSADGRLTAGDRDAATERLRAVRSDLPPTEEALAGRVAGLLVSAEVDATLASAGWVSRGSGRALLERTLPTRLERVLIIIGLAVAAFVAVLTTVFVLTFDLDALATIFPESEGPGEEPTDPIWWLLLGGTAILVGTVSAIAVVAMLRGDARRGADIGVVAMLINLVATGLLTFYVAQFEAVASVIVRVILLALILDYRGRVDRGSERPGDISGRSELASR